jgi:hypothetical protein
MSAAAVRIYRADRLPPIGWATLVLGTKSRNRFRTKKITKPFQLMILLPTTNFLKELCVA